MPCVFQRERTVICFSHISAHARIPSALLTVQENQDESARSGRTATGLWSRSTTEQVARHFQQEIQEMSGTHNPGSGVSTFSEVNGLKSAQVHQLHFFRSAPTLPGENLPVNLTQIAHDLDAKLLEFTLMAKARERVAKEAHSAAEAEKTAWREGETKRVEDEVRSLLLYTPVSRCALYALVARVSHLAVHIACFFHRVAGEARTRHASQRSDQGILCLTNGGRSIRSLWPCFVTGVYFRLGQPVAPKFVHPASCPSSECFGREHKPFSSPRRYTSGSHHQSDGRNSSSCGGQSSTN